MEPLVKHLWSKIFIEVCPEVSVLHLRRIRSHPENGEMKFHRFWIDIKKMEIKHDIKLLPEVSKNYENIKVFTEQEKQTDMFVNAKYNKKQV